MALMMKGRTNYPYAVARVQAKRGKLIPRAQYDKLLKMDVSEITRFIEESDYKAEVDELASRFKGLDLLEAALTVNEERSYAAVRKMLEGDGGLVVGEFLMRHFVEDVKTVMRGKNAGATSEELLKELLLEDLDTFNVFQPLLAEDIQTPAEVVDALERAGGVGAQWARVLRKLPDGATLSQYEDALDKAYFARLLEAAEGFHGKGREAMQEFVRREIDARNLHNAARWVHSGQESDFSPYVIPGGKALPVAQVMALAECKDMAAFDERLQDHAFYPDIQAGLAASIESGRLSPFTVAVRAQLATGLDRLAHRFPMSIVPILAYLTRKRQEVVTLRALARGKAAGLTEERLLEVIG